MQGFDDELRSELGHVGDADHASGIVEDRVGGQKLHHYAKCQQTKIAEIHHARRHPSVRDAAYIALVAAWTAHAGDSVGGAHFALAFSCGSGPTRWTWATLAARIIR